MLRTVMLPTLVAAALTATASPASAASITSQSRSLNVYACTFDYYFWDRWVEDSDSVSSTAAGVFDDEIEASASLLSGGGYSSAEQHTTINTAGLNFTGYGGAFSGIYVQSTGGPPTTGQSESRFEVTFTLNRAGALAFYGYVDGWNPGHGEDSTATGSIQIINTANGQVLLSLSAGLGEWDEFDDMLDLPAGTYKVVAKASALSTTGGQRGEFALDSAAQFQIYGQIFEY